MSPFTRYSLLLLVIVLCSSVFAAVTPTKPLYKIEVVSPKQGAAFKRGAPIILEINTDKPQGTYLF